MRTASMSDAGKPIESAHRHCICEKFFLLLSKPSRGLDGLKNSPSRASRSALPARPDRPGARLSGRCRTGRPWRAGRNCPARQWRDCGWRQPRRAARRSRRCPIRCPSAGSGNLPRESVPRSSCRPLPRLWPRIAMPAMAPPSPASDCSLLAIAMLSRSSGSSTSHSRSAIDRLRYRGVAISAIVTCPKGMQAWPEPRPAWPGPAGRLLAGLLAIRPICLAPTVLGRCLRSNMLRKDVRRGLYNLLDLAELWSTKVDKEISSERVLILRRAPTPRRVLIAHNDPRVPAVIVGSGKDRGAVERIGLSAARLHIAS